MRIPTVSVYMVAYNHEKFISKAIESVVQQDTNFDFELIISEDCSTDGTREIINCYASRYPDIIKPIYNEANNGAIVNFSRIVRYCKGQYIAILDGDDYWSSPTKLMQQVEFLDAHVDYSICFHKTRVFYEDQRKNNYMIPASYQEIKTYSIDDLFNDFFLPSSSVMFRGGLITDFPGWFYSMPFGDRPLYIMLAEFGKIGYINEEMSAYRIHADGIWSLKHFDQREYYLLKKIEMLAYFDEYFNKMYEKQISLSLHRYKTSLLIEQIKMEYKDIQEKVGLVSTDVLFNKKIVIFGTGEFAENMFILCTNIKLNVAYFVDNNSAKWGSRSNGIEVCSPEGLSSENKSNIFVLISSMYYREICEQLVNMSFEENIHFIFGLDLLYYIESRKYYDYL